MRAKGSGPCLKRRVFNHQLGLESIHQFGVRGIFEEEDGDPEHGGDRHGVVHGEGVDGVEDQIGLDWNVAR